MVKKGEHERWVFFQETASRTVKSCLRCARFIAVNLFKGMIPSA